MAVENENPLTRQWWKTIKRLVLDLPPFEHQHSFSNTDIYAGNLSTTLAIFASRPRKIKYFAMLVLDLVPNGH